LELGINYLDTAPGYDGTRCESGLGETLKKLGERPLLAAPPTSTVAVRVGVVRMLDRLRRADGFQDLATERLDAVDQGGEQLTQLLLA
jgi:predicted aldo/keto reductase-like oxidoreductase